MLTEALGNSRHEPPPRRAGGSSRSVRGVAGGGLRASRLAMLPGQNPARVACTSAVAVPVSLPETSNIVIDRVAS